ncbi:GntR family transcriptional regulator [Geobacillus sp. FSL K6-0789]|uniref:GntR family transcriptional regulator n=1 Tax=Geobacillus stearothermophilus TaxID=1422 RepID=A0A3L7D5E8_GEOSE|nr:MULTISPECIES: GntR family transcriptional regulator [Geobacillus]KMY56906.1 GntR family transcriptional regulator [Geobacillus stearothermophilus]KMY60730.1 GntR family transcriptional regulator [Geobacillus stearothermophilus]KMY61618.1 GntR family transcriptional regulator [Geobacillus stearothermophilus]MBR2517916.1 GntR family transcriptional regulator [Geobacillus sp.]RLQ01179.1 GntR family transcriptional regulator [Geobacillus stearothermophilus]
MINKQSPIPIYYQLEQYIKEKIEKGEWQPGEIIPSERELAGMYDISRMTVRQAVNNLVNDGYLIRRRGKGTFVAAQKIEQPLKGLTSFSEDMRARGMEPGTIVLSFETVPASEKLAEGLGVAEGDDLYKVRRLRLADGLPMALETLYIPVHLVPGLTRDVVSGSVYEFIEKEKGLVIGSAVQTLEASVARQVEAEHLKMKEGAPVLLLERRTHLVDGRPLEVVKSVYRGDRYKFMIEMKRGGS